MVIRRQRLFTFLFLGLSVSGSFFGISKAGAGLISTTASKEAAEPFCTQQLLEQPFLMPHKWAKRFVKRLEPAKSSSLKELGWKWTESEIAALSEKFIHGTNRRGKSIQTVIELHTDPKIDAPHVEVLFTLYRGADRTSPVGVGAFMIKKTKKGDLEADVDSFYIDPSVPEVEGVSGSVREFVEAEVYRPLGVKRETIFADYIGRYAWAKVGYSFTTHHYYWPEGYRGGNPRMKPVTMVQSNLRRFLKHYGVNVSDLVVRKPGSPERHIERIDQLETPQDFAYLFHSKGRSITAAPLIAEEKLGEPSAMPIGKAFMVSDLKPESEATTIYSQLGTRFSNRVMPKWRGVRVIQELQE